MHWGSEEQTCNMLYSDANCTASGGCSEIVYCRHQPCLQLAPALYRSFWTVFRVRELQKQLHFSYSLLQVCRRCSSAGLAIWSNMIFLDDLISCCDFSSTYFLSFFSSLPLVTQFKVTQLTYEWGYLKLRAIFKIRNNVHSKVFQFQKLSCLECLSNPSGITELSPFWKISLSSFNITDVLSVICVYCFTVNKDFWLQ